MLRTLVAALVAGSFFLSLESSSARTAAGPDAEAVEGPELELHRYDQPDLAERFFIAKRQQGVGYRTRGRSQQLVSPPAALYENARAQRRQLPRYNISAQQQQPSANEAAAAGVAANTIIGSNWVPLGPGNIGGRVRAWVITPSNPNQMYVGGAAGGVWKTTDAGASWTAIGDFLPNLAVNALAMSPADANTLYAGTGEGQFNGDAQHGNGIYKTTDAGANWSTLANTQTTSFQFVNKIVISTGNASRIYAATNAGVMRSLDSGSTWTNVLSPVGLLGGCYDLAIRTDNLASDTVFASCGTAFSASDVAAKIYRNTNAGGAGTWNQVYTEANMALTALAIAPSNQAVIYALAADKEAGNNNLAMLAVLRSIDGGTNWTTQVRNTDPTPLNRTLLSNTPYYLACFGGSPSYYNQGWYDNVIAVDPADSNVVWAGGVDLFRSDDGGANWRLASFWYFAPGDPNYAHADQHVIAFAPGYNGTTNQTMYAGNDGGLFRTTNARNALPTNGCSGDRGVHWASLNNSFAATQFYFGVPYPSGTSYFVGTQDNGTVRGSDGGGVNGWAEINGGDGGFVAIDPTNTNTLFAEYINLSISKSTDGGTTFNDATFGITESSGDFLFINPFRMAAANPQQLWTGGYYLWRTINQAASWTGASTVTPGNGSVSAIGIAPTDGNFVIAGLSDGALVYSQTALSATSSTTWGSTNLPGYVSSVSFDPANKNIAYATVSSFGVDHVFRSIDAGASWNPIDHRAALNGIPDIPAHTVIVDPSSSSTLYVGTDLGIYVTSDGGSNWEAENSGMANVIVDHLAVNNAGGTNVLYAFTHGRGAFRVNLPGGPSTDTTPDAFSFTAQTNVPLNSVRTSGPATITGINAPAPISVSSGTYSIGCTSTFTSATGTINNNQTVCLRHTSASTGSTSITTTLSIGGVQGTFTSTTLVVDTTPNAFTFTNRTNVALNTTQTSNAVTISGLGAAAAVSVVGGTYSVGCGSTFTSANGSINNNQTICVRHTSASTPSTDVTTTLTVGGVSGSFTTTTVPPDTTPNAFTFTAQSNVLLGSLRTSNTVTIAGITAPAPIHVVNGAYSIGCAGGGFTTADGTISNNQTVCVQHTAATTPGTPVSTTLNVGGVSGTFTSTTPVDKGATLANGTPVTGISGTADQELRYSITVPTGATSVMITITGGSGDADLYVRYGSNPSLGVYDCRPYLGGNEESCEFAPGKSGIYYVTVRGFSDFSGIQLTALFDKNTATALANNTAINGISGAKGSERLFSLVVPSGATLFSAVAFNLPSNGLIDFYVRRASVPTAAAFDCAVRDATAPRVCNISPATSGTYFVLVHAREAYSGLSVQAAYAPPPPSPASPAVTAQGVRH